MVVIAGGGSRSCRHSRVGSWTIIALLVVRALWYIKEKRLKKKNVYRAGFITLAWMVLVVVSWPSTSTD